MAKTSTVTINVSVTGDGIATSYQPPGSPLVNPGAPGGGPITYALSSGDNTIAIPPGSLGVFIIPASTSTVAKKLKGSGGDTGFPISPNLMSGPISLVVGQASLMLNAASAENITLDWV